MMNNKRKTISPTSARKAALEKQAAYKRLRRAKESPAKADARRSKDAVRKRVRRLKETPQEAAARRSSNTTLMRAARANDTAEEAAARRSVEAARSRANRQNETPQQTCARNESVRVRQNTRRRTLRSAAAEQRETTRNRLLHEMLLDEETGWTAPVDERLNKINSDPTYFDLFEQSPFRAVALFHLNAGHAGFRGIQTEDTAALIDEIKECCPSEEDTRRMITEMHKAHDFGCGNNLHSCGCCGMRSSNKRFSRRPLSELDVLQLSPEDLGTFGPSTL